MATATKEKSKVRLQPLGERLVVQREVSAAKTAGGILLPDNAKEKPTRGKILAVGTGRVLDDGTRSPSQLKAGDNVLFSTYAGETVDVDGEEFLLLREDDVLAILDR